MAAETLVVEQVVQELNRLLPEGDRWDLYLWRNVDEAWPATGTWQEFIPRASDPQVALVICLFGERLGLPLPDYFPLPEELALPDWVRFPWDEAAAAEAVPLTGTLFELLDAFQASQHRPLDERTGQHRPEVVVYLKMAGDLYSRRDLSSDERAYGFEHHFDRLRKGQVRIRDRKADADYRLQLDLLDHFCTRFLRGGSRPARCFGSAAGGPDGCLEDLRQRLRKDLPGLLAIPSRETKKHDLKGLAAYRPEDSDILFGRDRMIVRLLERLRSLASGIPVLALAGRSGEGKSSILGAGLVGRLARGRYPDFGIFHPVLMEALALGTDDPLAQLAEAIDAALPRKLWEGKHQLASFLPEHRPAELVTAVAEALAALPRDPSRRARRLFLGLDQFEELLVAAEEDPRVRVAVLTLLTAVRTLAEQGLAWVVVTLPTEHRDRLTRLLPGWPIDTEVLGPPGLEDLRDIIEKSLRAAGEPASAGEVAAWLAEAEKWLNQQENPGPVLPLLSTLMDEKLRAQQEARRAERRHRGSRAIHYVPPSITLDSVLDQLGRRAWKAACESGLPQPELALARLLRQLVLTGIREGGALKLLRHCPADHPAVRQAEPLVRELHRQRLLIWPQPNVLRLVHVAVIDNWGRAQEWYHNEREHQTYLAEIEPKARRWREAQARGETGWLLTDPHDLDAAEDLWWLWREDQERLPLDFMRASLMANFDLARRPGGWLRSDGGSRVNVAMGLDDTALAAHYLGQLSAADAPLRQQVTCFTSPETKNTPVVNAARHGSDESVRQLLALGADVNARGSAGRTPLAACAEGGRLELAEFLLGHGANPGSRDENDKTPLLIALEAGHEPLTLLLSRHDKRLAEDRPYWDTVIIGAANKGFSRFLRGAFPRGAERNLTAPSQALVEAAHRGHIDVVRLLLDQDVPVKSNSTDTAMALLTAVECGHREIVELLLRRGAPITAKPVYEWTALSLACYGGRTDLARLLCEAGACADQGENDPIQPLGLAAENGDASLAELLLKAGANPNQADASGYPPLCYAAKEGNASVVETLIRSGALIDHPIVGERTRGWTPLMEAICHGHNALVPLFISHRANLDAQGEDGASALIIAAYHGFPATVELLLDAGASPHLLHRSGMDASAFAAVANEPEILQSLHRRGADLSRKDRRGATPMHWASLFGKTEALNVLLACQREVVHLPDAEGLTPLDMAILAGHADCSDLLRSDGAVASRIREPDPALTLELQNAHPGTTLLKGMEINFAVNVHGKICLVHSERFDAVPSWFRYHSTERICELVFEDAMASCLPIEMNDDFHEAMLRNAKLLIVRMRSTFPATAYQVPIVLEH